jgi:hypothetical protein
LNALGAHGEIIFAIYRVPGCAYFRLETFAAKNEGRNSGQDNDIFSCPANGFHKYTHYSGRAIHVANRGCR